MLDTRSAFLLILVLISMAVLVGFVEWRQRGLACTTCRKPHRLESEVFACEHCGRSFCRNRTVFQKPVSGVLETGSPPPHAAGHIRIGIPRGIRSSAFMAFSDIGTVQDGEDWCGKIEIYPGLMDEEEIPHYFCRECALNRLS